MCSPILRLPGACGKLQKRSAELKLSDGWPDGTDGRSDAAFEDLEGRRVAWGFTTGCDTASFRDA